MQKAKQLLSNANKIVVLTGAGISADSGIPSFRGGASSFYNNPTSMLFATPIGWQIAPNKAWELFEEKLWKVIQETKPNLAHASISHLPIITTNIDGFHQRAGSKYVIELHGNCDRYKCITNGHKFKGS
jgi:NAD-dependent SIR2 family protein deacetylase